MLALDGISDPGNLGNILRTALALGWEGVFILHEGCDPFNEKTMRAARGANFRIPIQSGTIEDLKILIQTNKLLPYVASLKGTSVTSLTPNENTILVLGNEAHGPSEEIVNLCQSVKIPMPGDMESLNVSVAGGILMFMLRKIK